jgi:ferrous iron transport protein A
MTLSDLNVGDVAIVEQVNVGRYGGELANRLAALGVVSSKPIQVLRRAKMGGPLHIRVGLTTEIALRTREANTVQVRLLNVKK